MGATFVLDPDEMVKWNHNGVRYGLHCLLDSDPMNPVEENDIIHLACWSRRYHLGNYHVDKDWFWQSLVKKYCKGVDPWALEDRECQKLLEDKIVWTNLYLYDHSGIAIDCGEENPFNDQFDSGKLGIAFMAASDVGDIDDWKKDGLRMIEETISTYDQYLRGQVYFLDLMEKGPDGWDTIDTVGDCYSDNVFENMDLNDYGLAEALDQNKYEVSEVKLKTVTYYDYGK